MVMMPPPPSHPLLQDQLHFVSVALEPPMQVVGVNSRGGVAYKEGGANC